MVVRRPKASGIRVADWDEEASHQDSDDMFG
jgi:hypothetical protein